MSVVQAIFDRYQHLDAVLCDPALGVEFEDLLLRDLWVAVKAALVTQAQLEAEIAALRAQVAELRK
jgi:hypothetical protein